MPDSSPPSEAGFLDVPGETSALIAAFDWAATELGAVVQWPQSLKTTTGLLLRSPVPIVLLWGEHGRMIYNDAYSVFAGDRHPQLLGSRVREGWPEVADFNDNIMKVGLAGGALSYRDQELVLHRGAAPATAWMDLDYSSVPDESGRPGGVIAFVVETTDRVMAERRAAQEQARQRELLHRMPGFVAVLNGPEHVFEYVNDAYVAIAGDRELIGRSVLEAFPELEEQGFHALLDQVYAEGESHAVRGVPINLTTDAEPRFLDLIYEPIRDAKGTITGVFAGGYDVTETNRALAALRESETQLRLATENAEVGLWDLDPQADVLFWPPRVKAMFGISPDRPISMADFYAGLHPDDAEPVAAAFARALDPAERALYDVEYRTVGKEDGVVRWVAAKGRAVFDEADVCRRVIGTALDITARKAAEARLQMLNEGLEAEVERRTRELLAAQEALRQSQKMEAVGQLTGGIAHDFNNLLMGISGSLELMQARMAQGRTADAERYVTAAQGAARRAAALTHRLLAFSRRQTLDPKPTDVNRLVAGLEDLVRRTVGPSVELEVVGAGGLWSTLVDPNQLENAVLNLCINARDAMPDGGRITIETANKWLDGRAAVERDLPPGQYVSLCVTDTGGGMTAEVVERAFDPFFTTKPLGQGTGLGLSMIYGFVRQSGGQVRIYSELGRGTTMCLYLPRNHTAADGEAAGDGEADIPHGAGEVVLVVDDEPTIRMLVLEVLDEFGYAGIEAADGPAGLKVLRSNARIDLLVTDVGLPGGMNGRQVADAARVLRPGLKVLFITGYAENAAVGGGHLDPGMEVLTKPFAMEALAERIRQMIGGRDPA